MNFLTFKGDCVDTGVTVYGSLIQDCNNQGRSCKMIKETICNVNNGKLDLIPTEVDESTIKVFIGSVLEHDIWLTLEEFKQSIPYEVSKRKVQELRGEDPDEGYYR